MGEQQNERSFGREKYKATEDLRHKALCDALCKAGRMTRRKYWLSDMVFNQGARARERYWPWQFPVNGGAEVTEWGYKASWAAVGLRQQ